MSERARGGLVEMFALTMKGHPPDLDELAKNKTKRPDYLNDASRLRVIKALQQGLMDQDPSVRAANRELLEKEPEIKEAVSKLK